MIESIKRAIEQAKTYFGGETVNDDVPDIPMIRVENIPKEYPNVSKEEVERWISGGRLQHVEVEVTGSRYVRRSHLNEFLQHNKNETTKESEDFGSDIFAE